MAEHYPFVNIPLPYADDALEPYIDKKTMHLHHDKHLQTYIDNLNRIIKNQPELQDMSLEELIMNAVYYPPDVKTAILNNAGGVYSHQFYFANLMNPSNKQPSGTLAKYMNGTFGSYEMFQKRFTAAALSVFGSGYAWLVTSATGMLSIITTPNQNTPFLQGLIPVLNIDVWEHAYYLKHYNVRTDYIADWYQIINWEQANQNFLNRNNNNIFPRML